jgi:hypothetical protein
MEIIVAKSDRILTDDGVHSLIKESIKAHGAKNTILVMTKIDVCAYHAINTTFVNANHFSIGVFPRF